jgi:hypothetical protein
MQFTSADSSMHVQAQHSTQWHQALALGTDAHSRCVQAKHSTLWQQARALGTDVRSKAFCWGDVVAVVLEVGNWHALSVCGVLGI